MKNVFISIMIIFITSCENSTETQFQNVSSGYAILNQGSISSIDYFDLQTDSLISGIFQLNNNGETLSGYAEHMIQNADYIFVSFQGDFFDGSGTRVIVMNKTFEKLSELTDYPINGNTLYLGTDKNFLFVTYRTADQNFNYSYILRKYDINEQTGSISISQSGTDLNLDISGFDAGRFLIHKNLLYIYDSNKIQVIDPNSLIITKTIQLAKPISDLSFQDNLIYAGIYNLSTVVNDAQDIVNGGFYIIENTFLTDSVIGNYGFRKLLHANNRLFGIRWTGSGRSVNWPYSFSNLDIEMIDISGSSQTILFSEPTLASISELWVHFEYDSDRDYFLLPGSTDFIKSSFYIRDTHGKIVNLTSHPGQASNVLIIK